MRAFYLLAASIIASNCQALSIERNGCSNIKCNDPGCDGTNEYRSDGRGECSLGPCSGQPCLSVCPSADVSCNQFDCAGFYNGNDTASTCSGGDYAGCPCQESCPTTFPKCSDATCDGSSNMDDYYGICGSSLLSDCPCINDCPSAADLPKCSDDDCLGSNDPSGDFSVCVQGSHRGCRCTSQCPDGLLKCSDESCQGYNNAWDLDNSYCTAGENAGCRCTPICTPGNCTATDCNGINNLNGTEFCTFGAKLGCLCTSDCPKSPPSCADAANCDGFEGICTLGVARGCACSGSSPHRKRWPTKTIAPRVEDPSRPDAQIPSAYYVCTNSRDNRLDPQLETRSYPRHQIQQAIDHGYRLNLGGDVIVASNRRSYPQRFYVRGQDFANFNIPSNDRQIDPNRLFEFPIIRNDAGQFVPMADGQDPGLDRVVFDGATNRFAAVVTHRGEVHNRFHVALGHNQDVNVPAIENNFGATILDPNPLIWFGTGAGSLPLKRSPANPESAYPTFFNTCPDTGSGQCYCYNKVKALGWYPRDAAIQAINQACSDWDGKKIPEKSTMSLTKKITLDGTTWSIEMSVSQTLLQTVDPSSVKKQDCLKSLGSAMDNCQTNTVTKKIGGQYQFHIPNVGSQKYIIHPGAGNPTPSEPWRDTPT